MGRIGVSVALIALTWFAATSKLTSFSSWSNYTGQNFGALASIALYGIPLIEILLPLGLLSRSPKIQGLAASLLSALYFSFSAFHLQNIRGGNTKPCSCFGSVLSASPYTMISLTLILGFTALILVPFIRTRIAQWYRMGNPGERVLFHVMLSLCIAALAYRSAIAQQQSEPQRFTYEPHNPGDLELLEELGTLQIGHQAKPQQQIVAIVDPECTYSQALLKSLAHTDVPKGFNLQVAYYPILPSKKTYTERLAAISYLASPLPITYSEQTFNPALWQKQQALCDRFAKRTVPVLLGLSEGHLVRMSTKGSIQETFNRFSELKLKRS